MAPVKKPKETDAGMLPEVKPADPEADARGAAAVAKMPPLAVARQVSDGSDLVFEDSETP